jgi:hypothetical protein
MEFTNQYLTYLEYKKLGGALDEPPFNLLELKVQKEIDKYTQNRLVNLPQQKTEVKVCIFELMKTITGANKEDATDKNVASESYPGYSVTYQTGDENVLKAKQMEIKDIINTYLTGCKLDDGTPYLYRGVDKYEKQLCNIDFLPQNT